MRTSSGAGYRLSVFLLAGSLVACGGGGGGGGGGGSSSSPLSINSSNAGQVASEAYGAADLAVTGATSTTDMVTFSVGTASSPTFNLRKFADDYLQRMRSRGSSQMVTAQAVHDYPYDCESGNLNDSWNDADNNFVDSAGDSYSTTYNNCVEGGITMNGGVSATLGTLAGDTFGDYQISGSFSFNNLSISYSGFTVTIDGDMTYSASRTGSDVSATLQISSLTTADPSGSSAIANATLQYSLNESTLAYLYTISATLSGTAIGGQVTVATTTPFAGTGAGYPESGSMRVTGAGGSSVTVTAIGGASVRLDVDSNGDGVVDSTSTTTWAALESL